MYIYIFSIHQQELFLKSKFYDREHILTQQK